MLKKEKMIFVPTKRTYKVSVKKCMISISKPIISEEEITAVNEVLKSGMLAQGPKVHEFEEKFAKFCDTKYAIAVSNGTAGLHTALYALGIKAGDEVITAPFTFVASANSIIMAGAKVVFADIDEDDFCLSPRAVSDKITERTSAILPIDLYGQIYKYQEIKETAVKYGFKIIEDACQSIGASAEGIKAGNFGDVAVFSLYATKNIMCGEGGVITTSNAEAAERCRRFRHHGQSESTRYEYWDLGYNYRLTDLQAAIAIVQLKKANALNSKRIENAQKLSQGLSGINGFILPKVKDGHKHVFHQYTVRITNDFVSSREDLMNYLKMNGIGCGVYYPKPLHLHPHFLKMGYKEGDFPVAEKLSKEVLSLPVHPSISDEEVQLIIAKIQTYVRK